MELMKSVSCEILYRHYIMFVIDIFMKVTTGFYQYSSVHKMTCPHRDVKASVVFNSDISPNR